MKIGMALIGLGLINLLLMFQSSKRKGRKMMAGSMSITILIILIGLFMIFGQTLIGK